jgi:hypothetical protein
MGLRQAAFSPFRRLCFQRVDRVAIQATKFDAAGAVGFFDQALVALRPGRCIHFAFPFGGEIGLEPEWEMSRMPDRGTFAVR